MYNTNMGSKNEGIYLSHQMVDVLLLVNCKPNQLVEYIRNTPNLSNISESEIQELITLDPDVAKKRIFEKYQESYISYMIMDEIRDNKENEYRFHLKVKGLNLPVETEKKLYEIFINSGERECYRVLETLVGKDKTRKIQLNFMDDYENIKSATYEQMVAFNEQIKGDILRTKMNGGDYTLVIGSSRFFNTMMISPESSNIGGYVYDSHFVERGYELTKTLEAKTRFHCIIDCNTAKALAEDKHYSFEDKEQILDMLEYYTRESLKEVIRLNKDGQRINVIEIFNELVEYNKDDKSKPYQEVWEKYFGISLKEIIDRCIVPNSDLIQELKNSGVSFMYNETLLQESDKRREKVEEVFDEIQRICPGLIDIFGDQMHYTDIDLLPENIGQLKAEAAFLEKMQSKVKVECTEFDFGINLFTAKNVLSKLVKGELTSEYVAKVKQGMISDIKDIFKGVNFARHCDWTTLDNIDCRIVREGKTRKEKLYQLFSGKFDSISKMQKSVSQQEMEYKKEVEEHQVEREKIKASEKKEDLSTISEEPTFKTAAARKESRRIETETQTINPSEEKQEVYQQMLDKKQERLMENNKPKVLTLKNPNEPNTSGFIGIMDLLIIVGLTLCLLCFIVYYLCK